MAATAHGDGARRPNRWRKMVWGTAACLLLLPLIAMRFTADVTWDGFDFAVMGGMLFAACGLYELGARQSGSTAYRAAFGIAILAGFLLVWINLAVGIIGDENDPANGMFVGVLAVAGLGSLLARFRSGGMAYAMTATAIAQGVVFAVALVAGFGFIGPITLFFCASWLGSAHLFRKAAG